MAKITLNHYLSNTRKITLTFEDIASMKREDDHRLPPVGPSYFTAITLKPGCVTSEGKQTAHVRENIAEIRSLAAMARANELRL